LAPSRSPGRSEFLRVRGLRLHVRHWGDEHLPRLFLLHGWLDVSATFAPLVAPLLDRWQVLAPDARGFGYSEWPQDGYWFQDYVGDFEALLDHYAPQGQVLLVGHSMGAQIAALYAGARPQRVARLVCLDGIGLPDMPPAKAPKRVRAWLDELRALPQQKHYPSFEILAERVRRRHPQLTQEKAMFVARCWGREDGRGRISLLADPKHRMNGPSLYRVAEAEEIWKQITAPTLFLDAGDSELRKVVSEEERIRRRACFSRQQVRVIPGSGHMMHFDQPEATAAAIGEFLSH
jgi:pimeloyl-ACP methyl ester carboxylesterase